MSQMSEDDLDPLVTQCPNCDTRFRVTESQLQVASGRVRCGACLAVFEGTDYLTLDGERVDVEHDTDVDALLEELDEISKVEPDQPPALPVISDGDLTPLSQAELAEPGAQQDEVLDELLALEEALLDEMRMAAPAADREKTAADREKTAADREKAAADEEKQPEPLIDVVVDADDIDDSVDEIEDDETDEIEEVVVEEAEDAPQDDALEVIELEALTRDPVPKAIEKLPYYDEAEEPKRRSWFTALLITLALIGLPAQVLWFQYNAWVMDADYRPVYQLICDVAGCELPPMRDVSKIVAKKSFIRRHPDRPDARIVDVLMVNNASFPQPYPLIELIATNLQGQLVAGRRFKPSEYLQGDARGAKLMPPRTPVHVSLEIQDPVEEALNFEVHFRSQ